MRDTMPYKIIDIILSIIFSIGYGYYLLLAFAFGGLSGEYPDFYVFACVLGILTNMFLFIKKWYERNGLFITVRIFAILLQFPVIYFEITAGQKIKTINKVILEMSSHVMTSVLVVYLIWSLFVIFGKYKNQKVNVA